MAIIERNGLEIDEEFLGLLSSGGLDGFDALMRFEGGSAVKTKPSRSVVSFELGGDKATAPTTFYLKRHQLGFIEALRAAAARGGSEDARNEWEKLHLLKELGIPTMTPVAFGERLRLGLPLESLTLTLGLAGTEKLTEYLPGLARDRAGMEGVAKKRELIKRVADLAREFHSMGLNHQDFYLVHILYRLATGELFLADLQRVKHRTSLPVRWRVKDLAELAFSAGECSSITRTDFLRFIKRYLSKDRLGRGERALIRKVTAKSARIARHAKKIYQRSQRDAQNELR